MKDSDKAILEGQSLFKGVKPKIYKKGRFFVEDYSKKAINSPGVEDHEAKLNDTINVDTFCEACCTFKIIKGRFEITQAINKNDQTCKISQILKLQQKQINLLQNILFHNDEANKVILNTTKRKIKTSYVNKTTKLPS